MLTKYNMAKECKVGLTFKIGVLWIGLLLPLPRTLESQTLLPVNVNMFGNEFFADDQMKVRPLN